MKKVPHLAEAAFSAEEARQVAAVFLVVARAGVLQVVEFSAEDLKQVPTKFASLGLL